MGKTNIEGVPIIGQDRYEYWIGDRTTEGQAALLTLNLTPEQTANAFGHYVATRRGLPEFVPFMWAFTSIATEKAHADNVALKQEVDELRTTVEDMAAVIVDLTDRLSAIEV